jgi:2-dehydro-3-deoxygluconokinase
MLRNVCREQGIDTRFFVWAHKSELMGRYIYEMGRTPRRSIAWYQRKYSAASRLGAGMVDWQAALRGAKLFHISGITLGLASHSGYKCNHNLEAFQEALTAKPNDCKTGLDFNYRSTLWSVEECQKIMTPVIRASIDWFITTLEDMAGVYNMDCGKYSAEDIKRGDIGHLSDTELKTFAENVQDKFRVAIVGITLRYPDSFEDHRWESIALDSQGNFFRSPKLKPIALGDRIGGGDTWNSGFYYGLLTEIATGKGIQKGVQVGDAISQLKQTLMFDLGIITKEEIQTLIDAENVGGGKREMR